MDPCTTNTGLRSEIVLGTDFLAGSRENNTPEAIRYILAHQIGHFVAHHNTKRWIVGTAGALSIPCFKTAMIRNLEFTADAYAAKVAPDGAVDALALCATGKDNYPYVNPHVQPKIKRHRSGIMGLAAKWTANEVPPPDRLWRLESDGLLAKPEHRVIPHPEF